MGEVTNTCAAVRSVADALSHFLWLDLAATEGVAVPDLFPLLLSWRNARGVGAITGGVHPPVEATVFSWGLQCGTVENMIIDGSYLRSGASWQVQLHWLLANVRLVMVPNSRLLGRDLSLLFSRCSDLRAVTPAKAPSENWEHTESHVNFCCNKLAITSDDKHTRKSFQWHESPSQMTFHQHLSKH